MKITVAVCSLLLLYSFSFCQEQPNDKIYDFSKIDLQKICISKIESQQQRFKDSLKSANLSDSLQQLLDLVLKKTKSYDGILFGVGFPSAQINKINHALSENGFAQLSSQFTEINIGFFHKEKKWIQEIQGYLGLNNKSHHDNTTLKLMDMSVGYNVGYDLLNIPWLTLYPYAGLAFQADQLTIEQQQHNDADTTLFGAASNNTKTTITKGQLDGTAGAEIDFYLMRPKNNNHFFLTLAARWGASLLLIDGRYKANGHSIQYYPDWSFRNSYAALSIKIGGY